MRRATRGPRLASPGTAAWCSCCLHRTAPTLPSLQQRMTPFLEPDRRFRSGGGGGGGETLWWCRGDRRTPRRGDAAVAFRGRTSCFWSGFFLFFFLHTNLRSFSIPLRSVRRFSLPSALDSPASGKIYSENDNDTAYGKATRRWQKCQTGEREKVRRDKFERSCAAPLKVTLPPSSSSSLSLSLFIDWPGHFADSSPSEPRFRQRDNNNNSTERFATRSSSAKKNGDSLIVGGTSS